MNMDKLYKINNIRVFSCNKISQYNLQKKGMIKVKFYGSKIRIITTDASDSSRYDSNAIVKIDNKNVGYINSIKPSLINSILSFEKSDLTFGIHTLEIDANFQKIIHLDAIDIDDTGHLIDLNESISLDYSTMDLTVGESKQLTATTTSVVGVKWTTSDSSIASIDQTTGKVTGVKGVSEGNCNITATTADGLTATCTVTVTKRTEPSNPTDNTGDGNLYIEMIDGNIKKYSVSSNELNKFIQWYEDRTNNTSNSPYYKFSKSSSDTEYLVHDKIVGFEIK